MRALLFLAPPLLLAACSDPEPENVQARAADASIRLEERYNQIQAEAESDVAGQTAPIDNEAAALLNQLGAAAGEAQANARSGATGNAH